MWVLVSFKTHELAREIIILKSLHSQLLDYNKMNKNSKKGRTKKPVMYISAGLRKKERKLPSKSL